MAKQSRGGSLSSLSIQDLQREINKRMQKAANLHRTRNKLMQQVAKLDAQIAEIEALRGGAVLHAANPGPRPGRPAGRPATAAVASSGPRKRGRKAKNEGGTLVEFLQRMLKGKTMRVKEMPDAVKKEGYHTDAANFRTMINQALIKHTKIFKKVGRGEYTAV